jgi:ubiquinol oxidase
MESLGGNAMWSDRFLGYHVAIGYYWALVVLFFFSPAAAYEFMEVGFLLLISKSLYLSDVSHL